ncbi:enoyl-CoA hydratase-related protein [bacterium]|nr:enoyl-CoA hydratase-related protein [bacterium]
MSETTSEPTVITELEDGLVTLTLNRPNAYNALNLQMGDDLLNAVVDCDENPDVRAVLITGNGKAFCSGGDIRQMQSEADAEGRAGAYLKRLTARLHIIVATIARMPKPVITAVNGPAAGAGLSLALSGDMVLAAENANFTVAYTAIGLAPDGSSTYYLPRMIGPKRAFELMALNRAVPAKEAAQLGMINQVFSAETLADEARKIASDLASGPTRALAHAKTLVVESGNSSLETAMEYERRAIADCGGSADFIEGSKAFFEKRKAVFKGL